MNKGFAAPLVIAIGVLVIAVVAGVVGYSLKSTPKPSPTTTPTSQFTQATPTFSPINEVADWKTYTHVLKYFSVRYPNDWVVEENLRNDRVHTSISIHSKDHYVIRSEEGISIPISVAVWI